MRITTRGRYALRSSLALARLGKNGEPVAITRLAEAENISGIFLEQIFYNLRKAGVVRSVRGPGGGFCFAKPLEEITVKMILDAAGEELDLGAMDAATGDGKSEEPPGDTLSRRVWTGLRDLIDNYFTGLTLASLVAENA